MLAISCLYPLTGHRLWLSMCKIHGGTNENPKKLRLLWVKRTRFHILFTVRSVRVSTAREKQERNFSVMRSTCVRVGRAQPLASTQCMISSTNYSGSNCKLKLEIDASTPDVMLSKDASIRYCTAVNFDCLSINDEFNMVPVRIIV
jgi:hypothetical protein